MPPTSRRTSTKSSPKSSPDFALEDAHDGPVCGIDEAGRAPLAGPVMAACVFAPPEIRGQAFWRDVNDSKQLSKPKREHLAECIRGVCAFGIASASVEEIDEINIFQASLLAMRRAYETMTRDFNLTMSLALIDGKFTPQGMVCAAHAIIKGDGKSRSIAAASILAKTARDEIMVTLSREHPGYGWERNAGYPVPEHVEALARLGITPHHRRSFGPVRTTLEKKKALYIMS